MFLILFFFFSSRRRHTRLQGDWSSDVCSSDLYVFLTGIANVTIDLQYSDLYFANGDILGIQLANCTNVTLKNFTADYLHLPFTQVTVTSVSPSARTIGFATLSGYPLPSSFNSYTPPPSYVRSEEHTSELQSPC